MDIKKLLFFTAILFSLWSANAQANFVAFESGQVRPIAQSPDGAKLFVVNTPDNTIEIFDVNGGSPVLVESVSVGLEPVAVAAYSNNEVWVVNYLSDSVSIVDVASTPARVKRTLLVGDEPADIVFAGAGGNRAFITTAHRGQNSPYTDPANPGELTTPGIGRADVWIFDVTDLGADPAGEVETIVTLFGDTPKALTVSPDGSTVYAAVFKSGNKTTVLSEGVVCDGGSGASPCTPDSGEPLSIGGLPDPSNQTIEGIPQPEVGLIVKHDGAEWRDELGRSWSNMVRFNLPDSDVFAIDANAPVPVPAAAIESFSGVGTVLYNMAVNPVSGKVYVANTEAINEVRFEGSRAPASTVSSVRGHLHEARITVIDPSNSSVTPRHLNKHIDYSVVPSPPGVSDDSLAIPKGMAVTSDGKTLYVVAKGSGKVGMFDTAKLEDNSFAPNSANHIVLTAGGPGGLLLDEANDRLYVTTRFDNGLSVIDTLANAEIDHITMHNPEPLSIINGRRFLYDASYTSSNGEASCASCHIEGDKDELSWDLGNPDGTVVNAPEPFANTFTIGPFGNPDFHPMKGPMATQTLRGMANHGPMHWRGDRVNQVDHLDEDGAFKEFNGAFVELLGRNAELTAQEMQDFTDFVLQLTMPPNPIRNLDNSLTPDQQAGSDFYFNVPNSDGVLSCNGCHVLAPPTFFGTNGNYSFEGEPQHMKIPQLRNMYEKVGMFGMANAPFFNGGNNGFMGDQIRGFGFLHDGSVDTLFRFHDATLFQFGPDPQADVLRAQVEQFMFAFDTNLKPVVGQQYTVINGDEGLASLLVAIANNSDVDIVAKVVVGSETRGYQFVDLLEGSGFAPDKLSDPVLDFIDLVNLTNTPGQEVTFTMVPPGSGYRIGLDRDDDGWMNRDDNCPNIFNNQDQDNDSDGLGDVCDPDDDNDGLTDDFENGIGTNPFLADTDGDTISDFDEVLFDGNGEYDSVTDLNPLVKDTDGDGFDDNIEIAENSNPLDNTDTPANGDLNNDGVVNAADVLLATQIALGERVATANELLHGDIAPTTGGLPSPDGQINAADLVLIQQKAIQ